MKILVTGGAGFIGANFIHYVLKQHPEDSIICFDAMTYAGNLKSLTSALSDNRFSFYKGDISERAAVDQIFDQVRPDIVVNFAAESHVDRSITNPDIFMRTNVIGVGVLLDACRKYDIKRFHQVSTDEVYGDLPIDRADLLFTEETPIHPSSPYAASKASADLMVYAYYRTYGIPVSISRCSNNYGPYHFPEKLIPLMIINAMKDTPLPVYGDGKNIRDWLYVADHCAAIDRIIRADCVGEIYNIGGHNERSNLDVVKSILSILNKPETLIRYVADRPGHDLRYAIDPGKLQRELDWTPTINFEQGLERTVRWYQENTDWWQGIIEGDYAKYYDEMYGKRERIGDANGTC